MNQVWRVGSSLSCGRTFVPKSIAFFNIDAVFLGQIAYF